MDDLCHAVALLQRTANALHDGRRQGWYLYQRLELATNDRQRGPQLVRCISRETMIVGKSFLEPLDHAIQCKRKSFQLVSCRNHWESFPKLLSTYALGLFRQDDHRP